MNRSLDPDFDQRIADWLEGDPTIAPRETLGTVLAAYPSIPQRAALRPPWRLPAMSPVARFATAAAIAVALVGTAIVVIRPGPSVGTNPSAETTPTAIPSPTVDPNRVQALQISGGEELGRQTYLFDGAYSVVVSAKNPTQDQQCSVAVVARIGDDFTHDVPLLATSLAPGSAMSPSEPEPITFPHGEYHVVLDLERYFGVEPSQGTIPPDQIRECTDWSITLTAH